MEQEVIRRNEEVRENKRQLTTFIFVTSQTVTGAAQDKFERMAQEYGWNLQIYDKVWMRLQLEEVYPDLTKNTGPVLSTLHSALAHFINKSIPPSFHMFYRAIFPMLLLHLIAEKSHIHLHRIQRGMAKYLLQ